MRNIYVLILILIAVVSCRNLKTEKNDKNNFAVIAYYTGDSKEIEKYPVEKLTHIIFSFLHLKGNELAFDKDVDRKTLRKLTSLKKNYKNLKVLISLGGWGGCKTCSEVFASKEGRTAFAGSVKKILTDFNADGIDLDWEYPAIEGYPGHRYTKEDKHNFTLLVKTLRKVLGDYYIISFAAGGFTDYIKNSIEWKEVMPVVDMVNVMTYDLVNGYSTVTGHHTPLYSNPKQKESVDNAVRMLDSIEVDKKKIIIGAAFYARVWESVPDTNNGLYQPGKFKTAVNYKDFDNTFTAEKGFKHFWDVKSKAPYMYNTKEKLFATFDDPKSIALKTRYAIDNNLGGIMFWELTLDKYKNGLVDVIYQTIKSAE